MSEKREKFLSMSEKRKEKAIKAIAAIGNLSTPSYEWERTEIEQLLATLQLELDNTRGRFERTRRWKGSGARDIVGLDHARACLPDAT